MFDQCQSVNDCLKLRDELLNSGEIAQIKESIKTASKQDKKEIGKKLNELRKGVQELCDTRIQVIQKEQEKDDFENFDPTFYSDNYRTNKKGHRHPITTTMNEVSEIFTRMGFDIVDGSFVLDQYDNFTSVNTPDYHPARDMQDTFFLDVKNDKGENYVMRTQMTSNIAKYMENHQPPFRTAFLGLTFRNETIDATHDVNFHQFDMWLVDKDISISHLVVLMNQFFKEFFDSDDIKVRLRPSFFPFVEPGYEADIFVPWYKGGSWVEVCGCGIIQKDVLSMGGIDPHEWGGIAWGFGLERLCMIKHQLTYLSQFYEGKVSLNR